MQSMPKKLPTADAKQKAGEAAAATQAPAKKTCPHRTPQTPFESLDEETTYIRAMLRPLTHGSRWRTSSAARSRFVNTRSCERKKKSKPRPPCWQSGRRPRTLLLQLKWISRPAMQRRLSFGSFVDFMASVAHLQAPVAAQVSKVKSEAQRYLELSATPMNTDPLEWWEANEINFPVLILMVRQYLGVPATSASGERLFSLSGHAFDDLRQRMKEEMLEILMWARINKEKRQRD